jgi:hypothetical protein
MGKVNGLGLMNNEVLVQEYLDGQEYVVDMVSRDGVHKVVALWASDRRDTNHSSFLCHGLRLISPDEINSHYQNSFQSLVAYHQKVLTALGILNGPSHGKLKWCNGEPVLIGVTACCHGGEGTWTEIAVRIRQYPFFNSLLLFVSCRIVSLVTIKSQL